MVLQYLVMTATYELCADAVLVIPSAAETTAIAMVDFLKQILLFGVLFVELRGDLPVMVYSSDKIGILLTIHRGILVVENKRYAYLRRVQQELP